ncbi:Protein of unknown function [Gryllus bimaculatus]|nr:Protein of unknown function [Gryllus bimaculatus]
MRRGGDALRRVAPVRSPSPAVMATSAIAPLALLAASLCISSFALAAYNQQTRLYSHNHLRHPAR